MKITRNAVTHPGPSGPEWDSADHLPEAPHAPLSADEARQWRRSHNTVPPWRIVVWQVVAGVLVSLGVVWVWGVNAAVSTAYGALAVVLPSALMVWGVLRPRWVDSATSVVRRFAVWELVKLGLTVAMLVMAPRWIEPVNWLALVAGFVVTMKVLGVAAWLYARRSHRTVSN